MALRTREPNLFELTNQYLRLTVPEVRAMRI
eukprot:COSAG01_NODE_74030_length_229_cov_166.976923_1_plen_30_part_01